MSEPAPEPQAWQPFTPSGIARFAGANYGRVLAIQIIVALSVAATLVWFLSNAYSPIILSAIQALPETGEISKQRLNGINGGLLSENRFLSVGVDTDEMVSSGVGDIQLRFAPSALKWCSLFGCVETAYPPGYIFSLSRTTLEPAWEAWRPMIFGAIAVATWFGLLVTWNLLAIVYMIVPKLLAFYWDRELTLKGSWRVANVAQMSGALLVILSIFLYGVQALDLLRFLILYILHMPVTWVLLVITPWFLPKKSDAASKGNPFEEEKTP